VAGLKPTQPPDGKRLKFMIAYALCSGVYKWVVMFGSCCCCWLFQPLRARSVGVMLVGGVCVPEHHDAGREGDEVQWKQRWEFSSGCVCVRTGGAAAVALVIVRCCRGI